MKFINQKNLADWLDDTSKHSQLVAPKDVNGVLLYRNVSNKREIVWEYIRPVLSAKEFFFPPTERLLSITKTDQTIQFSDYTPDGNLVLFGIRPCDARGIKAMDALFIDKEPVDMNYSHRRRNSVIIGLACSKMGSTCFCTSTGGAPDDPTGMDVLLKQVDGGFSIETFTDKGKKIINEGWITEEIGQQVSYAAPSNQNPIINIPDKTTWPPHYNDSIWEENAQRCLSCRICAYVCPTCRCFDVRDEPIQSGNGNDQFERIRCWDSCSGDNYRRIAGGHNPRAGKEQRLRNRMFCKFYYYPEQYGPIACTGCGRCINSCPVNIDITEVMSHVNGSTR